MQEEKELKTKQKLAAQLLLAGLGVDLVATRLKISADTIYRWRKLPEFKALMENELAGAMVDVKLQMVKLYDDSLKALSASLGSASSDKVRLQAAMVVLKLFGVERLSLYDSVSTGGDEYQPEEDVPSPTMIEAEAEKTL